MPGVQISKTVWEIVKNERKNEICKDIRPMPKILMDLDYPNASGALD
jgi:hypothetical protein